MRQSTFLVGFTIFIIFIAIGTTALSSVRQKRTEELRQNVMHVEAFVNGAATGTILGIPCSQAAQTAVAFEGIDITLMLPCGIGVGKNTEPNRRGTFAAYNFSPIDRDYMFPLLAEIQFFSRESIGDFDRHCDSIDYPCFFGARFTSGDYLELKSAYEQISDWKEWHMFVFDDRNWLVRVIPCTGGSCAIREYAMFHGDTMIVVWIQMEHDNQGEAADALFGALEFTHASADSSASEKNE